MNDEQQLNDLHLSSSGLVMCLTRTVYSRDWLSLESKKKSQLLVRFLFKNTRFLLPETELR